MADDKKSFFRQFDAAQPAPNADSLPSDISLLAVGEALGHGLDIDDKSIQTAFDLLAGKSLKSFNNHTFSPAPTDILGYFSGIYIDAEARKLRAKSFNFLKTVDPESKARLSEIINEHADTIGVSLTTDLYAVWIMDDGSELAIDCGWWGATPPKGCSAQRPVARFTSVFSADFVSSPAANPSGLFSARDGDDAKKQAQFLNQKKDIEMKKAIDFFNKKFGAKPALLALAIAKLADGTATDENAEEVAEEIEKTDELKQLKDKLETAEAENKKLTDEIKELKAKLEETAKPADEAELEAKLGAKNFSVGAAPTDGAPAKANSAGGAPDAPLYAALKAGDFKAVTQFYMSGN